MKHNPISNPVGLSQPQATPILLRFCLRMKWKRAYPAGIERHMVTWSGVTVIKCRDSERSDQVHSERIDQVHSERSDHRIKLTRNGAI